jgi:hypothetical protein
VNLSFLFEHSKTLLEAVALVHAAALLIVNITPTPKDDELLTTAGRLGGKAYRAIEILAGIVTPLVKR